MRQPIPSRLGQSYDPIRGEFCLVRVKFMRASVEKSHTSAVPSAPNQSSLLRNVRNSLHKKFAPSELLRKFPQQSVSSYT
jgi:hypothetical protein